MRALQRAPVGDDLERDGLVEREVVGLVDLGETAAADLADQLVAVAPVCEIGVRCSARRRTWGLASSFGLLGIRYGTIRTLSEPMGEWRNWQTR